MEHTERRDNNFGFLRLLLAALVIVSHSPEMLDGNRSREILTRLFGIALSFGDLAVDGFFIISGYLITQSFLQRKSIRSYLKKRVLRIFPGYLVNFWICVLLVAPAVGAPRTAFDARVLFGQFSGSLLFETPYVAHSLTGLPIPVLNVPVWSIKFEFGCYIAAMCAGMMGLYSRRLRAFALVIVLFLLWEDSLHILDVLHMILRLAGIFGVGTMYYVYRDKLQLTGRGAVVSAVSLFFLLFSRRWAETSVAIFGGYLIFWIAFKLPVLRLSQLANNVDLSYGVYLYAWPIASVIVWRFRHINPWLLCAATFVCVLPVAYLSWTFVEKPSLELARKEKRFMSIHASPAVTDA